MLLPALLPALGKEGDLRGRRRELIQQVVDSTHDCCGFESLSLSPPRPFLTTSQEASETLNSSVIQPVFCLRRSHASSCCLTAVLVLLMVWKSGGRKIPCGIRRLRSRSNPSLPPVDQSKMGALPALAGIRSGAAARETPECERRRSRAQRLSLSLSLNCVLIPALT
jgi:hypothetical protein